MKKVIVTVGPSLFNDGELRGIHNDDYIYRVNGAHGGIEEIEGHIDLIREELPYAEILIDLPGNKVRTANLGKPVKLEKGKKFKLLSDQFNYGDFHKHLSSGDAVLADDSTLRFVVEEANEEGITFLSESDGFLLSNKGCHVRGIHEDIPFLFSKDKELIELANKRKVGFVGLSFVRSREDIKLARELIDDDIEIISKVETRAAVDNLNEILEIVDYILVDRGDLSTDVGLEKIPSYQKFIVERTHFHNKKTFLATQFLKNMEEKPIPTIAEIIDMYNTFKMGIYGIQLSEETSIGAYPGECLEVIRRVVEEINSERQ
ncbi:MAG: pyruvate kinase [Planctomycetota bacterium]|jgi:pyruvate kinase